MLLIGVATPAASSARQAGEADTGNIPISGVPPGTPTLLAQTM